MPLPLPSFSTLLTDDKMECVCYLGEGADYGALYDSLEEEEVDVFGPRGGRHVSQVIQHLLHGWRKNTKCLKKIK